MPLEFIVAFDKDYAIGRADENALPWHIPSDLQRFKELTNERCVVMGRRTWESLPSAVRPLPDRENFVLSHQYGYRADGAHVLNSIDAILNMHLDNKPVMIIGGGEMFRLFLPHAQRIHCTIVDASINLSGNGNDDICFPFDEVQNNPAWSEDKAHHSEMARRNEQDDYQTAYQCWERLPTHP